jgi:hypothetical protein
LGERQFSCKSSQILVLKMRSRLSQLLVEINYVFSVQFILNLLYQSNEFSWIFQSVFRRQRNNAIDKHYLIVIKDLIPLIEWTCYFKKLFEGIDFKNFACRVKNFPWHKNPLHNSWLLSSQHFLGLRKKPIVRDVAQLLRYIVVILALFLIR